MARISADQEWQFESCRDLAGGGDPRPGKPQMDTLLREGFGGQAAEHKSGGSGICVYLWWSSELP
jgi:hypothetical protein